MNVKKIKNDEAILEEAARQTRALYPDISSTTIHHDIADIIIDESRRKHSSIADRQQRIEIRIADALQNRLRNLSPDRALH